jgi:DNA invertase Pin-like site-specific DNA recombinase
MYDHNQKRTIMAALSELEQVKRKIATTEARLAKAEADSLPIDNPGVIELRRTLNRLYDEKASLRSSTSCQFFEFYSECIVLTMK